MAKKITQDYLNYLKAQVAKGGEAGASASSILANQNEITKKTDYDSIIPERSGDPVDTELYNQVKREAKAKFDVYPSAVANAWLSREYKSRGGKYGKVKKSKAVVDLPPGHTVADVERHDEGHDNWHAMHGDPPCKDEADCARMRASYKEENTVVKYSDSQERDAHGRFASGGGDDAKNSPSTQIINSFRSSSDRHSEPTLAHISAAEQYAKIGDQAARLGDDKNAKDMYEAAKEAVSRLNIADADRAISALNGAIAFHTKSK